MRKLTLTLLTVAVALGMTALVATAQTQRLGAGALHAQGQNFTPITKQVACNGWTGAMGCGPGWIWSRYWHRCVRC